VRVSVEAPAQVAPPHVRASRCGYRPAHAQRVFRREGFREQVLGARFRRSRAGSGSRSTSAPVAEVGLAGKLEAARRGPLPIRALTNRTAPRRRRADGQPVPRSVRAKAARPSAGRDAQVASSVPEEEARGAAGRSSSWLRGAAEDGLGRLWRSAPAGAERGPRRAALPDRARVTSILSSAPHAGAEEGPTCAASRSEGWTPSVRSGSRSTPRLASVRAWSRASWEGRTLCPGGWRVCPRRPPASPKPSRLREERSSRASPWSLHCPRRRACGTCGTAQFRPEPGEVERLRRPPRTRWSTPYNVPACLRITF
jgi:hypothetical protein